MKAEDFLTQDLIDRIQFMTDQDNGIIDEDLIAKSMQDFSDYKNKETLSLLDEMAEALEATLKELEYSLHNQGAIIISDYDKRQNIIDENKVMKKGRLCLQKHKTLKDVQK